MMYEVVFYDAIENEIFIAEITENFLRGMDFDFYEWRDGLIELDRWIKHE